MEAEELKKRIPENEFRFSASKSSGPGGQNVNKVNSRVEIRFKIDDCAVLTEEEKGLILKKLTNRINNDGELIITAGTSRSQLRNRESAIEILYNLLAWALTEDPERKPTIPTLKSQIERLEKKKRRSSLKKMRRDPDQSTPL
jgi:ribosome-associated protein